MSHEIRTPLSGVLGLARLLQDASLPPPRRSVVPGAPGRRRGAAQRHRVGRAGPVQDRGRPPAGRADPVRPARRRLERVPHVLADRPGARARDELPRGARHAARGAGRPGAGAPDPVELPVQRAEVHRPRPHRTCTCSGARPTIARIEISDTGIGVSAELRATLFQPFTQADSSTTRRFGGSGLGLSICRELATLMGGDVGLDSDGRSGSCAWVDLPLVTASEDDFTHHRQPARRDAAAAAARHARAAGRGQPGQPPDRRRDADAPGRRGDRGRQRQRGDRAGLARVPTTCTRS